MIRFQQDQVRRMVQAALLAHADERELPLTIEQVEGLARAAMRGLTAPEVVVPGGATGTTPMRREVLYGIAIGETARETGQRLCLSVNTIRTHRKFLFRQLRVSTCGQAVAVGIGLGLITTRRTPSAAESGDRLRAVIAPSEAGVRP